MQVLTRRQLPTGMLTCTLTLTHALKCPYIAWHHFEQNPVWS